MPEPVCAVCAAVKALLRRVRRVRRGSLPIRRRLFDGAAL